jgi:hypothetical protein
MDQGPDAKSEKGEGRMGIKKEELELQEIPGIYRGRTTEAGDFVVTFEEAAAGDPAPLYRGLPGDRCQARHFGFLFKGKLVIRYPDREEEVNAGEAYYLAPGHLPLVVEDSESVEFTPKAEFEATMLQIMKNLEATGS